MEVLVVDNGSSDESPRLDAEFPNTTFLRLPKNFGRTKAFNIGVRTAVGDLVLFLSPEVEVTPDAIPLLASCLEADAGAVAVCPFLTDSKRRAGASLFSVSRRARTIRRLAARTSHPGAGNRSAGQRRERRVGGARCAAGPQILH